MKILDKLKNSILGKSAVAFSLKILSAALSFTYSVVLANIIGAEGAGKYYLAFTILGLTRIISMLGMKNVVLKHISFAFNELDFNTIQFVLKKVIIYVIFAGLIVTGLVFSLSETIADKLLNNIEVTNYVKLISLAIIPSAILLICSEFYKAIGKFKVSLLLDGVLLPTLGLIIMPTLTYKIGSIGAIISLTSAFWLIAIFSGLLLLKTLKKFNLESLKSLKNKDISITFEEMFKMGYVLLIMEVVGYLIGNIDKFIISYFVDDISSLGVYAISQRLALMISFILFATNAVITPKFSVLYRSKQIEALEELIQKTTRILFLLVTPVVLFFILFPTFVLSLFGEEFSQKGGDIFQILVIGAFINVITGSVGFLLILCDGEAIMRNIMTTSLILIFIVDIFLVQYIGIKGIAIGNVMAITFQNVTALFFVKKRIGIKVWNIRLKS